MIWGLGWGGQRVELGGGKERERRTGVTVSSTKNKN